MADHMLALEIARVMAKGPSRLPTRQAVRRELRKQTAELAVAQHAWLIVQHMLHPEWFNPEAVLRKTCPRRS